MKFLGWGWVDVVCECCSSGDEVAFLFVVGHFLCLWGFVIREYGVDHIWVSDVVVMRWAGF